jgi:stringent starvation protein B
MVHPVQSVVESLYASGRCPRLHVNALADGVVCPDFIREQWQERLIIDLDSSYPLDLTFAEDGIGADLSFGGYVTRCSFPWASIYVVADRATGRGIVLDQNMPESVRRSRQAPTTGPLPAKDDLTKTSDDPEDTAASGERPAIVETAGSRSKGPSAATSTDEEQVKQRRAAFKVIDGGG